MFRAALVLLLVFASATPSKGLFNSPLTPYHPSRLPSAIKWMKFAKQMNSIHRRSPKDLYKYMKLLRSNWMEPSTEAVEALKQADVVTKSFYAFKGRAEGHSEGEKKGRFGFLFVPGALVNPASYAPILEELSRKSSATIVCVHAPLRNPMLFSRKKLQRIKDKFKGEVDHWVYGGHSLGSGSLGAAGFVASDLTAKGLIMWAGTVTGSLNLSEREGLDCLVLLGSEDTIVSPEGKTEDGISTRDSIKKLPRGTKMHVIEGGNHAGFGNYGAQHFPFPDGERKIVLEKQQEEAVRVTATFLEQVAGNQ